MKTAAWAALLAALTAAAAAQNPASSIYAPGDSEQVETGTVHAPTGIESYRIRLLPIASFPQLPSGVAGTLRQRGCMIPQSFEAEAPENVIQGSFRAAGSQDWAALCSVRGNTTLLVFFQGEYAHPFELRSQPDTQWLGAEPGSSVFGSAWGISTRSLSDLRESPLLQKPPVLDHDAIDDARLEKSDTIRYHFNGQWLILNPSGTSRSSLDQ